MEEKIEIVERVLEISARVITNHGEEKTLYLTEFFEPQDVNITYDNNSIVLTIKRYAN